MLPNSLKNLKTVGKFVIFFSAITGGAEILRIVHSARDLRTVLNTKES